MPGVVAARETNARRPRLGPFPKSGSDTNLRPSKPALLTAARLLDQAKSFLWPPP